MFWSVASETPDREAAALPHQTLQQPAPVLVDSCVEAIDLIATLPASIVLNGLQREATTNSSAVNRRVVGSNPT